MTGRVSRVKGVARRFACGQRHAELTWGAARAGLAVGVASSVADGVIPTAEADALVLIAAVWVDWEAGDVDLVYENNRRAVLAALAAGRSGFPDVADVLASRWDPANPFFRPSAG